MTLAKIAPRHRRTIRLHGWLLALWVGLVGFGTSAVLLHIFNVRSMSIRYAVGAGMVYFVGFVLGGWQYAKWWIAQQKSLDDLPTHATPRDQMEYEQSTTKKREQFGYFEWLGELASCLGDDPISALLGIVWLLGVALGVLMLLGYLPYFATELFAGYLAEIVLEFVIGGLLVRQVLKPTPLDAFVGFMVRKTWLYGVFFILTFGVFGGVLQHLNPDAVSLLQVFQ